MCGLSSKQPYCNNSHKKTADEEDNKTYAYEREGERIEVKNWEIVYQVMLVCYNQLTTDAVQNIDHAGFVQVSLIYRINYGNIASVT